MSKLKNKIKKVGEIKEKKSKINPITGKLNHIKVLYTYNDVEYDIDGWADCMKYLPADFDLVYLRLERERTIPGWISGTNWDAIRLKSTDKVLYWKRKMEAEE